MKTFLLKCFVIILPFILLYGIAYQSGYYPIITGSISFDAKILDIKHKELKHLDVIAIGSSICLYNLNSAVITDSIHRSYYNFGVWGYQMEDLKDLIKSYVTVYKPKYVLLPSNFSDFELGETNSLPHNLSFVLNFTPIYYIENYVNFNDIIARKNQLNQMSTDSDNFSYLGFDKYGGVSIKISDSSRRKQMHERLKSINYLLDHFPDQYTSSAYRSLDSLALFLQTNKVKLIFIQSPFADNFLKTTQRQNAFNSHIKTCRAIVEKHEGIYLNFEETGVYPDSLFGDPLHMNGKGSKVLTKKIVTKLKSLIVN